MSNDQYQLCFSKLAKNKTRLKPKHINSKLPEAWPKLSRPNEGKHWRGTNKQTNKQNIKVAAKKIPTKKGKLKTPGSLPKTNETKTKERTGKKQQQKNHPKKNNCEESPNHTHVEKLKAMGSLYRRLPSTCRLKTYSITV